VGNNDHLRIDIYKGYFLFATETAQSNFAFSDLLEEIVDRGESWVETVGLKNLAIWVDVDVTMPLLQWSSTGSRTRMKRCFHV
jgi:hypothetical protein